MATIQYPSRSQQDASKQSNSAALPNASGTANTTSIDLETSAAFPSTEEFSVQIVTTASANAANSKNVNIALQDSADNSSFANIAAIGTLTIAANSTVYPATTQNYRLPDNVRRYVRGTAITEANGGNASDATFTVKLMF